MSVTKDKCEGNNFHNSWQGAIEDLFQPMIRFFNIRLYKNIDWSTPPTFLLNKELRQVIRSKKDRRYANKLASVLMKDGKQTMLYIHAEVQASRGKQFAKRMFVYHYRMFEEYGEHIWSMAVLGDLEAGWHPKGYSYGKYGCRMSYKFPSIKLLDYGAKWSKLERSKNPFALVVMAHLKARQTCSDLEERSHWKLTLLRMALTRKLPRPEVVALVKFIDCVITLPSDLERCVVAELNKDLGSEFIEVLGT